MQHNVNGFYQQNVTKCNCAASRARSSVASTFASLGQGVEFHPGDVLFFLNYIMLHFVMIEMLTKCNIM